MIDYGDAGALAEHAAAEQYHAVAGFEAIENLHATIEIACAGFDRSESNRAVGRFPDAERSIDPVNARANELLK